MANFRISELDKIRTSLSRKPWLGVHLDSGYSEWVARWRGLGRRGEGRRGKGRGGEGEGSIVTGPSLL